MEINGDNKETHDCGIPIKEEQDYMKVERLEKEIQEMRNDRSILVLILGSGFLQRERLELIAQLFDIKL